ncbi:hypothetical protein SKTS_06540 [Sulfurimicrobium lacus]|uniref:DUF58 domain-containing protein n=1 Tax=Sulfurimicrobium lacus TaxID=2715678 RepID=A0A6F8V7V1_9PROT|nr:DUF58 domain-containing protein [Sulfurimicrobium lacus]BCB25768.1 hypothetical protein SKTS_06540 [Sulfurimicrobium lacus]
MIPHRPLLIAAWAWLALGLLAVIWAQLLALWLGAGAVLALTALLDAVLARRRGNPLSFERETSHSWPVGRQQNVTLKLACAARPAAGWIQDRHPDSFEAEGLPAAFRVAAGQWTKLSYRVLPDQRGVHRFGAAELRLVSPLGFWLTRHAVGEGQAVQVYPDFAKISQYALFAVDNRLSQIGLLRRRRRGEGLDFHQLREYRSDDSPRQIDWKATSRMGKLIARDYQDERDQQIVFMLDCGQRMRARDDALSHFDHTLNAMLLLAYVALRQGDAVGLSTFAHDTPRFFAPRKSLDTVQRLLNTVFDLQPSLRTPDYRIAGQHLAGRLTRRSLIVLLTNLRDEDDATLAPALAQLRRRHLVLVANLRETGLDRIMAEPVGDFDTALTFASATDYLKARERQIRMLQAAGARVLDAAPPQLPMALVNRYWELKRSGVF